MPIAYTWMKKHKFGVPESGRRGLSHKVNEKAPRRDRVISKALLRAVRRWDLYADRVKSEKLDGRASSKTIEWSLILENGRLIRNLRRMDYIPERSERLESSNGSPTSVSKMPVRHGAFSDRRRDDFGE